MAEDDRLVYDSATSPHEHDRAADGTEWPLVETSGHTVVMDVAWGDRYEHDVAKLWVDGEQVPYVERVVVTVGWVEWWTRDLWTAEDRASGWTNAAGVHQPVPESGRIKVYDDAKGLSHITRHRQPRRATA